MLASERRYDLDWIRVIAIILLLFYHTAIAFQPWGFMIGFITSKRSLAAIWPAMALLNVWRIPILFFISGMGIYFTLLNRSWKQLLADRTKRVLVPLLTGIFLIVPLQICIMQQYYHQPFSYMPHAGHLWFLANIFIYIILLLPVFIFLNRRVKNNGVIPAERSANAKLLLLIIFSVFVLEVLLVKPAIYELYAFTWHGFFLGLLAFLSGFYIMTLGPSFWKMLTRFRWLLLSLAVLLYIHRLSQMQMKVTGILLVIESLCWIFSVFAFGLAYLNHGGKILRYLGEAAYPVYIMHILFLDLASLVIFPMSMHPAAKFALTFFVTATGSLLFYEVVIRKINVIRFLFGLRIISNRK